MDAGDKPETNDCVCFEKQLSHFGSRSNPAMTEELKGAAQTHPRFIYFVYDTSSSLYRTNLLTGEQSHMSFLSVYVSRKGAIVVSCREEDYSSLVVGIVARQRGR
jgi:hypothetical protein